MLIIVIITDLQLYPRSPSGVFIKAVKLSSSCEHLGERQVFNTDMLQVCIVNHYHMVGWKQHHMFWKLTTKHILATHNGSPYKCEHCGKTFRNPETYHRHLFDKHTGKDYKCKVDGCDLNFDTRNKLKRHLMHKHKDKISLWKPIGRVPYFYDTNMLTMII